MKQWVMRYLMLVCILLTAAIGLSACGGSGDDNGAAPDPGMVDGGDTGTTLMPQDDFAEQEKELIERIKEIASDNGLEYSFELMYPVIEDEGAHMRIYFLFYDENMTGSSPEALVSKDTGQFISTR